MYLLLDFNQTFEPERRAAIAHHIARTECDKGETNEVEVEPRSVDEPSLQAERGQQAKDRSYQVRAGMMNNTAVARSAQRHCRAYLIVLLGGTYACIGAQI